MPRNDDEKFQPKIGRAGARDRAAPGTLSFAQEVMRETARYPAQGPASRKNPAMRFRARRVIVKARVVKMWGPESRAAAARHVGRCSKRAKSWRNGVANPSA
jgi:hypothetical protein